MILRRILMLLALLMIGEGLVTLIHPRRYLLLWVFGPPPFQDFIETLRQKPELTRSIAVGELALGLWLALGDTQDSSAEFSR